ncbi:hypothetical protein POM88_023164 [Heracleum sosnowskyi]|uniref:Uncharacterized protein n=1 Tax=Heracleum sosnowskyi TaxID=360622 RepID=A0AAD8MUC4_9APIA|nr:hypothetical protein POM88_023164 [Heracleum sosnowskyi]
MKLLGKADIYFFSPEHPPLTEEAQRALDWAIEKKLKSGKYFVRLLAFVCSLVAGFILLYGNFGIQMSTMQVKMGSHHSKYGLKRNHLVTRYKSGFKNFANKWHNTYDSARGNCEIA